MTRHEVGVSMSTRTAHTSEDAQGPAGFLRRASAAIADRRDHHAYKKAQERGTDLALRMLDDGSLAELSPYKVIPTPR